MENNITVNMENLSEEEREQLIKLIKKSNKPKSKIWKPEYDEEYFYVSGYGVVGNNIWKNDYIDNGCYKIGNCFKTEEDAKFALEKAKVEAELRRFAEENNEFDTSVMRYFISYNLDLKITIDQFYGIRLKSIYFSSKEAAEKAIKTIGEERLRKYYLEIED